MLTDFFGPPCPHPGSPCANYHRPFVDGRKLRRYARRWIVERFFAWMQWKRRLLVRWEFYPANFLGFVQLAALSILLKGF